MFLIQPRLCYTVFARLGQAFGLDARIANLVSNALRG